MKIFCIAILLIISLLSFADSPFGPSTQPFGSPRLYFELMGGGIVPTVMYSNKEFNALKKDYRAQVTGGAAFRVQYSKYLSNSAQISYRQLGVEISSKDYLLRTNYINAFLPFEFQFNAFGCKKRNCTTMLAFVGPYAALGVDGNEKYGEQAKKMKPEDFGKYDYGAEAGIGIRIPTYSTDGTSNIVLKISYFRGFKNSYTTNLTGFTQSDMDNFLISTGGNRFNHGISGTISIELPLYSKSNTTFTGGGDGKRTYKRFIVR